MAALILFVLKTESENKRIYIHYLLCVLPVKDVLVLVDGQQVVICNSHLYHPATSPMALILENLVVDGLGLLVPSPAPTSRTPAAP